MPPPRPLRPIPLLVILAALLGAAGCASAPAPPPRPAERSLTILAINDVYRIEGLDGGRAGSLARVRTLRAELEAAAPGNVLLLHAGDALFPSLLSRAYQGKQMIDVLNLLDGDPTPGRIDERMFVTFGNHEFDQESCAHPSPLARRVAESDFVWLHANVAPTPCPDGQPRLAGVNLLQGKIVLVGGIRVGLFGVTLPTSHTSVAFLDPLATAAAMTADLRRRGAEVVIALTHLTKEEDEQIYAALRDKGLDLIIGGHEHEHMALPPGAPRIFKADADAITAWVITVRLGADGAVRIEPVLREVGVAIAPDPAVAERVAWWLRSHEAEFCAGEQRPPTCLSERLAIAGTPLVAEEERIRNAETSLGNWVADTMRAAFAACGADAAMINAGGLRLNHDLPAGAAITRRDVEELIQFATPLYLLEVTGDQLRRAMDNAISTPGAGRWLQIGGIAFVYDPAARPRAVTSLFVRPPGGAPVDVLAHPAQRFRVVVNEYLPRGEEDGYVGILPPIDRALPCPAAGTDLKRLVFDALRAQGTIAPRPEGRVCTTGETAQRECQAAAWSRPAGR